MPLDGVFISGLAAEFSRLLTDARVDKIQMPEKDEIILQVHGRNVSGRLLISANANYPRMHFSRAFKENPMSPPMFCMLLRKHLTSAKITGVTQPGLERMIRLDFLAQDELGERSAKSLVCELMGRFSNLILVGEDGRIIDCLKRVDVSASEKRQLLPGMIYRLPPRPEKIDFDRVEPYSLRQMLAKAEGEALVEKWLLSSLFGLSPLVCREFAERASGDTGARICQLSESQREKLVIEVCALADALREKKLSPWAVSDPKTKSMQDFSCLEITQYGGKYVSFREESFSDLLEKYYTEKDKSERIAKSSSDIFKLISRSYDRIMRKLALQREELKKTFERDLLREKGDILSASIHLLKRGMEGITLENFYDEMKPLEIKLDSRQNPQQNIARYYKEYNRMKSAESHLLTQIEAGEKEAAYLESVLDELARAESEKELRDIREELRASGYLAKQKEGRKTSRRREESEPLEYITSQGAAMAVGRNNLQNDMLTMKIAGKRDYWFHVKNIPGAHVILAAGGEIPPDSDISEAAAVAAVHSRAGEGDMVEVDYCPVSHVRKPNGAKPGMVIYEGYSTLRVQKDTGKIEKLKLSNEKGR